MHLGSRVLWGCSAPPMILFPSPQLCQNGGLSVSSLIGEREKRKVGGGRQSCYVWSKIPGWKRKFETVLCRNATASSFVAKLRGELFAHFHAVSDSPSTAHTFFPKCLSNHCQDLHRTFSEICTTFNATRCSFVGLIAKWHQTSYTTLNKRT
jgi:hypothetical protein